MSEQKIIYVVPGQRMSIECLCNGIDQDNMFFLVRDEYGNAIQADQIVVGDVVLTADKSKISLSKNSMAYTLLCLLEKMLQSDSALRYCYFEGFGTFYCVPLVQLAAKLKIDRPATVREICKALGLNVAKDLEGEFVLLEKDKLLAAHEKFTNEGVANV